MTNEWVTHYPYGQDNLAKLMASKEIPTREEYVDAATKDMTYTWTRFGVLTSSGEPLNGNGIMQGRFDPSKELIERFGSDYDKLYDRKTIKKQIRKLIKERMAIVESLSKVIEVPERFKVAVDVKSMDSLESLRNCRNEYETLLTETKRLQKWFPSNSNESQDLELTDEERTTVRNTIHGMCKLNDFARNNFETK